ncbi:hypothetical protein BH708_05955 [Brachybacterium sp. P6-10-X1]|uniref:hypothetical protein n=1 Tax=Brachybacterium sp. P6-10-X1 TaxID=1903186 RepID=UPI000971838F|nr:hypothetical protein [Brachybacterium sp. P6-10-X1]APX32339.1 hypothetical protein BH708_05955 [Brachybacterium sp. P6-10-X1]
MAGDSTFQASQFIPDVPYAEYAKLLGLHGVYCDDSTKVAGAWEEALASDRPVVLEFKVDKEIPPLPPRIKTIQAKKAAKAMAKGDPETKGVIAHGMRQKLTEFYEKLSSNR